jgi:hypothetical protein
MLLNALERVIEVQLFDRVENAIGDDPIVINPHHIANQNVLRLGNIDDLHFVAMEVGAGPVHQNDEGKTENENDPALSSMNGLVTNATSQIHSDILGDGSSFEFKYGFRYRYLKIIGNIK